MEKCEFHTLKNYIIVKDYFKKIHEKTKKIIEKYPLINKNKITFEDFFTIFKNGKYGKIASDLSNSEDYV